MHIVLFVLLIKLFTRFRASLYVILAHCNPVCLQTRSHTRLYKRAALIYYIILYLTASRLFAHCIKFGDKIIEEEKTIFNDTYIEWADSVRILSDTIV